MCIETYFKNAEKYSQLSALRAEIECWGNNPSMEDIQSILKKTEDTELEQDVKDMVRKASYLSEPDDYEGVDSSLDNLKNYWKQSLNFSEEQIATITHAEHILQMLFTAIDNSDQEADRSHMVSQLKNILTILKNNHDRKLTFVYDDTDAFGDGITREYDVLGRDYLSELPQVPISAVTHAFSRIGQNCFIRDKIFYTTWLIDWLNKSSWDQASLLNTEAKLNVSLNHLRVYNRDVTDMQACIESEIRKIDQLILNNKSELKNRNKIIKNIVKQLIKKMNKKLNYHKCMGRFYYSQNGSPNIPNWLENQ